MAEEHNSFDERLNAAERRQGIVQEQPVSQDDDSASLAGLALRAGTEMVAALVVGCAIGWGLDRWFGFRALFLILFAFMGGASGVLNVWRLFRPPDDTTQS
ncbi:MAG: AtpZ/AtpI family protein [Acetobacter sp.]|jgi:ATP synthase protein I|nr:AtpZ/AtpI family protein [Acetobacter sp.]MCH4060285.1 AtpZ/AtpI family protein [Acetobacter sp.]MCH4087225.1 AtpZ/AtpI family protein [Acetobacter sp.]MCI1293046.1 AtpZ/AtpI family protein [Acetobacter sp.]MCI1319632.1 AtpZ/AtpI family protein [Acetobacter sp.]